MPVELTSPVLGQDVGTTYTGTLEAWLLSAGYAKQAGYTGPGVSNTGAAAADLADDPREAENRGDKPRWPAEGATNVTIANDVDNLTKVKFPVAGDFDRGGVDDDAPSNVVLDPTTGAAAGGDVVTITGDNLAGVTDVTFGGVSGTGLDVSEATNGPDGTILVTTPAGAAGPVDVVLVDPAGGNTTLTGAFTYA